MHCEQMKNSIKNMGKGQVYKISLKKKKVMKSDTFD